MTDTQLRTLDERLTYLRALYERRDTMMVACNEQGKLTPQLKAELMAAETKSRLEDLYLPYKLKRRTKAQRAIEAGLEPLADKLLVDTRASPEKIAQSFVAPDKNIPDIAAALEGARYIIMERLSEHAESVATTVFKTNLHHLLMAAPAGKKMTLGLDPGFRTGVKTLVLDDTGKLLAHAIIYPHAPQNQWDKALYTLATLCQQHKVTLVSIGNGTASRETERLVHALIKQHVEVNLTPLVVSEAGASVYSASALAAQEFPELDVSYRGAISIARRLQDPLSELVKIDPKAIGVGQYQHDVNQTQFSKSLHAVMEDCVNAVGADVNTASVPLLKSIAGLKETVAQNIVTYREQHGRFADRKALKKVLRLGEKTYEQAIGFLRIIEGKMPLDASAVHPEAYGVVDAILQRNRTTIKHLMGDAQLLNRLKPEMYVTNVFGVATVRDIIKELKKPGRDPRPAFKTARFKKGVETIADLTDSMQLEGTVTNVTSFGAFVDIGVHQDGLVHISELADHFVSDPNTVVTVGQVVNVNVKSIDEARKRIQLTMKMGKQATLRTPRKTGSPTKKYNS